MSTFYQRHTRHFVAVDCVIFGFNESKMKLLVIKWSFEPEIDKHSLMGGFLRDHENLDDAARRILQELTGLSDVFLEQVHTCGNVDRDPGARVISVTYYALLKVDEHDNGLLNKHGAFWVGIDEIPDMIFDHNQMVIMALETLRHKSQFQPIGFELLPKKFTIPRLQKLYEAIYGRDIDQANFRKKIISMNLLNKLNEKDKKGSKRGAYFYSFDKDKYDALTKEGFLFEI